MRLHNVVSLITVILGTSIVIAQTRVPTPIQQDLQSTTTPQPATIYEPDELYPLVIVADETIWRGEIITEDRLTTTYVEGQFLMELDKPYNNITGDMKEVVGSVALCDMIAFSPINTEWAVNTILPNRINCGKIPMSVPLEQFEAVVPFEMVGSRGALFVETEVEGISMMLLILEDAEILSVDDDTVRLFVRDNLRTRRILDGLIDGGATLTLSPQAPTFSEDFYPNWEN